MKRNSVFAAVAARPRTGSAWHAACGSVGAGLAAAAAAGALSTA
ncbi:MAG: hypothetical protein ACLS7Z_05595 [Christensenellales bacterium]